MYSIGTKPNTIGMNLPKPLRSPEVTTTGTTPSFYGNNSSVGFDSTDSADGELMMVTSSNGARLREAPIAPMLPTIE